MEWYFSEKGRQAGPISEEQLKSKIAVGSIKAGDLVWTDGMADWVPVSSIPELAASVPGASSSATPPPEPVERGPVTPYQPQGGPQQPLAGGYQGPPVEAGKSNSSMILGICALVFSCMPCIGLILGILAISSGNQFIAMAQVKSELQPYLGKAKAGKIMGIIAIVLSVLGMIGGALVNVSESSFQSP